MTGQHHNNGLEGALFAIALVAIAAAILVGVYLGVRP